jgi:hypothetical protein
LVFRVYDTINLFYVFLSGGGHPLVRGVLRDGFAQEIFSDPQFGIFPAELHLGVVKTDTTVELVPKEIRS